MNVMNLQPTTAFPEYGSPICIAFTIEQAERAFFWVSGSVLVLCVDVPRAEFCSNLESATHFFSKGST